MSSEEKNPLISVLIPVKNGMPYMPQIIESIQVQDYQNFEIIVQDAVSTDGTVEYLKELSRENHLNLIWESCPDKDIPDGYDRALSKASGDIISMSSSNSPFVDASVFSCILEYFQENPNVDVVYGGCNLINEEGDLVWSGIPDDFDIKTVLRCELVPPWEATFIRSSCLEGFSFPLEMMTQDFYFWVNSSDRSIRRIKRILVDSIVHKKSNIGGNIDLYDNRMIPGKIKVLKLAYQENDFPISYEEAFSGVYLWAAQSMVSFFGNQKEAHKRYLKYMLKGLFKGQPGQFLDVYLNSYASWMDRILLFFPVCIVLFRLLVVLFLTLVEGNFYVLMDSLKEKFFQWRNHRKYYKNYRKRMKKKKCK